MTAAGSPASDDRAPPAHAADPSATLSPYGPSLNSLAAVLGANASAERDGERLALADVVSGAEAWNPRFAAAHGVPALEG